jgi:hypothetical protein
MAALAVTVPGTIAAQSMTPAARIALIAKVNETALKEAERMCLVGEDRLRERKVGVLAGLTAAIKGLFVGLQTSDRQRVSRGALDAPAAVYGQEQTNMRTCMARLAPVRAKALLDAAFSSDAPTAGTDGYPPAIDVRFNYRRTASLDPAAFDNNLRVTLREPGRQPRDTNLASQSDPGGSPYFSYTYYPFPKGQVQGTLSAKPLNSRLTADQAPRAAICFERAPRSARSPAGPDLFDCTEGGLCKPAPQSGGWLRQCAAPSAQGKPGFAGWLAALSPVGTAHAQPAGATAARRWMTPSIESLALDPGESVGYSYFKIRTDAFRGSGADRVEVAIAVNGVPVDEDGLAPAERPVPNDPEFSFDHLFALQTLNFEGREGGCDRVSLTLTPRRSDGTPGAAKRFDLLYTALRDQPERSETADGAMLRWSATVIRPIREWRHWAIVHSYGFRLGDAASKAAAVTQAEADKAWLDAMGWTIDGAPVRGVVRPPLTIRNGSGSFGLAIGLLQPSGQVRFTFSETRARTIGAFMIARRPGNARASRVIAAQPYLYQAPSGGVTPAGVCGN